MPCTRNILLIAGLAGGAALLGRAAFAGGWGPHGRSMGSGLLESYDTNDDGKLTQAEIDAARQANLATFDSDANGALSLPEYQALWADTMRRAMVRQFQAHDADGDGSVTVEEFTVRFADVVEVLDRNGDGELTRDELRRRGHRGPFGHGRDGRDERGRDDSE
jgi:Ca2+-binding EF-hand superfamily protein